VFGGQKGTARISLKVQGNDKTVGNSSQKALTELKEGLQNERKAYIYHCENHYMCPVGFEVQTPELKPLKDEKSFNQKTSIIIADTASAHPTFHNQPWENVYKDLEQLFPSCFNIRKPEDGLQVRDKPITKAALWRGNNHCIMEFSRTD
jgi:hypothetical protein